MFSSLNIHHELSCWFWVFGLGWWFGVFLIALYFDQWTRHKNDSHWVISEYLLLSLTISYYDFWSLAISDHLLLLLTPLTTSRSPHTPKYSSLLSESFLPLDFFLLPCYLYFFLQLLLATSHCFYCLLLVPALVSISIYQGTLGIKSMSLACICHQACIFQFKKENAQGYSSRHDEPYTNLPWICHECNMFFFEGSKVRRIWQQQQP